MFCCLGGSLSTVTLVSHNKIVFIEIVNFVIVTPTKTEESDGIV